MKPNSTLIKLSPIDLFAQLATLFIQTWIFPEGSEVLNQELFLITKKMCWKQSNCLYKEKI